MNRSLAFPLLAALVLTAAPARAQDLERLGNTWQSDPRGGGGGGLDLRSGPDDERFERDEPGRSEERGGEERGADELMELYGLNPGSSGDGAPPDTRHDGDDREGVDALNDPDFERAEPDLGHKVIAGLWTGTVEEVGQDPYTLRLSLAEDGSGTAAYSGLDCASDLVPLAGRPREYRETITMGRDACEDGFVHLRLHKGLLLWTWKDADGEVRAAATLRRGDVAPPAGDADTSTALDPVSPPEGAETPDADGQDTVNAPDPAETPDAEGQDTAGAPDPAETPVDGTTSDTAGTPDGTDADKAAVVEPADADTAPEAAAAPDGDKAGETSRVMELLKALQAGKETGEGTDADTSDTSGATDAATPSETSEMKETSEAPTTPGATEEQEGGKSGLFELLRPKESNE